jgi:hypothetical protein
VAEQFAWSAQDGGRCLVARTLDREHERSFHEDQEPPRSVAALSLAVS